MTGTKQGLQTASCEHILQQLSVALNRDPKGDDGMDATYVEAMIAKIFRAEVMQTPFDPKASVERCAPTSERNAVQGT